MVHTKRESNIIPEMQIANALYNINQQQKCWDDYATINFCILFSCLREIRKFLKIRLHACKGNTIDALDFSAKNKI